MQTKSGRDQKPITTRTERPIHGVCFFGSVHTRTANVLLIRPCVRIEAGTHIRYENTLPYSHKTARQTPIDALTQRERQRERERE